MNTIIPKTRRKVNFKNYKEVCKALKEQEYKRGSKEKEEQIKRWEKNLHIHKQKDNSFLLSYLLIISQIKLVNSVGLSILNPSINLA